MQPESFEQRSEESLQRSNPYDAWLWLWRGLQRHPKHSTLQCKFLELTKQIQTEQAKASFRVLHGTMEIGNQMHTMSRGLAAQGVFSKTLNYYPYYLAYQSDYTWDMLREPPDPHLTSDLIRLTREWMAQYDVFHFHFGTSLHQDHSDLPLLKDAAKTVVMHHWGSEVRRLSLALKTNPYAKAKVSNEQSILQRLNSLSPSIDHCIIPDFELYPYVKEFYPCIHIVPPMIDLETYQPTTRAKLPAKPLIVHAPTNRAVKGTDRILTAIEQLQDQYDFDFMLVQNKSHTEAKAIYEKADLIIDQLHIGSYGIFAIECMAMGKPVVCYISEMMKERYPQELPIIDANPDTIQDVLEHLLSHLDALPEIGLLSRRYAETHHDMRSIASHYIKIYESASRSSTPPSHPFIQRGNQMVTVSLCMIVKNEEDTLARCLDTVHDLVDEINIVDTGSTDRTVEIAKRYTDRVFHYEWTNSFAQARNESFKYATQDYILYLDADDVLLEPDREKFRQLIATLDPAVDSVSMYYDAGTDEFGNITLRYRRNRLVKRSRHYRWYGDCHVYLNVQGHIINSDISITHRKVRHSVGRALNIYAERIQRGDPFSPRDYFYYGNELRENGKYEQAIENYNITIGRNNGWVEDKIFACIYKADCHRFLDDQEQELSSLLQSFHFGPPKPEALSRLGYHFYRKQHYQTAIYWYEAATRHQPDPNQWSFSYPAYYTWYPHLQLCICYYRIGNFEASYNHNEEARKYRPQDPRILHNKQLLESKLQLSAK